MPALVSEVIVMSFRTVQHTRLALGPLSALVGEPETGKSNLLAALRAVLDHTVSLEAGDQPRGSDASIAIDATLAGGRRLRLAGTPGDMTRTGDADPPPVVFLPALLRGDGPGPVAALEAWCEAGRSGVLVLIEEPELYLRPQEQRFLYRLLRRFVEAGNQVVYSTRAPTFLNAARLDEVVFVERADATGTRTSRAAPLTADQDFRVLSEFDAERSELLLARAALLVEGLTEKLAFPFVFAALGFDHDREGITIVECGGKANIPLFARVCAAAGVPCVAVHDRDAPAGRRVRLSERINNAAVLEAAGRERTVTVVPDFEGLARLPRGAHKPEQAWRRFADLDAAQMPEPLARAVRLTVELARRPTSRSTRPATMPGLR